MKRSALIGAVALFAIMGAGDAYAQNDSAGTTGLGDAKAAMQPSSVGISNGSGELGYRRNYPPPGSADASARATYQGRSAIPSHHRNRHHERHL
ncbi:MAG: hypothetical protein NVSMB26_06200 [Beijerinckiaceae bacterium]